MISTLTSLILSSLVILTTLQGYVFFKKEWQQLQHRLEEQSTHHAMVQFLKHDVQVAGYKGVSTRYPAFPFYMVYSPYAKDHQYFQTDKALFGFINSFGNCFGKMPLTACERAKLKGAVLILYQVPQHFHQLKENMKAETDPLILETEAEIQKKSMVLISDAKQADLFIASDVVGNKVFHQKLVGVNQTAALSKCYSNNAEVVELQTLAYYLGSPSRSKTGEPESYSLYRDDFLHPAVELITHIEDFSVDYIVMDPKLGAKAYPPDKITHWADVRGIRLEVISRFGKKWSLYVALRNRYGTFIRPDHGKLSLRSCNSFFANEPLGHETFTVLQAIYGTNS